MSIVLLLLAALGGAIFHAFFGLVGLFALAVACLFCFAAFGDELLVKNPDHPLNKHLPRRRRPHNLKRLK